MSTGQIWATELHLSSCCCSLH
uniref:Uncharacterized protein n=1 Tax=Arundo donax TaxID=35708 RepID=A0A0A8YYM7_ARUDO